MRSHKIVVLVVVTLLMCAGGAQLARTSSSSSAKADESCLFTTDDQISLVIQLDMKLIDAQRIAAASCSNLPPSSPSRLGQVSSPQSLVPDAESAKNIYQSWLSAVASGITAGSLGSDYAKTANSAQGIAHYTQTCSGGGVELPDCGTSIPCQHGQAEKTNFLIVGKHIVSRFKGCSTAIRQKASNELYTKHSWN
jgi:hypothetical protein